MRKQDDQSQLYSTQAERFPKDRRPPEAEPERLYQRPGPYGVLDSIKEWPPAFEELVGAWSEPIQRPIQQPIDRLNEHFRDATDE